MPKKVYGKIVKEEFIIDETISESADIAFKCHTDFLSPKIEKGDILLIQLARDGITEFYSNTIIFTNHLQLHYHKEWINGEGENSAILGKVVGLVRKFE